MKLRIKGNSLRLRVSRSELDRFSKGQRIHETIHFGSAPNAKLSYALERDEAIDLTVVKYGSHTVTVQIPFKLACQWEMTDMVGLSGSIDLGPAGTLDVLVEKDFACLDQNEADNEDTFPNPHSGSFC